MSKDMMENDVRDTVTRTKAVVMGGGTGAPASIKALRSLGVYTDVVVAMADDGGSSGMLRGHTGKVPPGDVRKCIVALARDPQSPWVKAFTKRFPYINNHTLGNLILSALEDTTYSFTDAIRLCEELLEAEGQVFPSTLESVNLTGITRDGSRLDGQSVICKSQTALAKVRLTPASPQPNQEAIRALLAADLIVLGPGSLFTSIIPNLLVPGILDAIRSSNACKVFVCSLKDMQGETWGLTASEHVEMLFEHGLYGALDVVIVHRESAIEGARPSGNITGVFQAVSQETQPPDLVEMHSIRPVVFTNEDARRIQQFGVMLVVRDLSDAIHPTWHDNAKLADAFKGVIQACHLLQR